METKLNNPMTGKEREQEIIYDLLEFHKKMQEHGSFCFFKTGEKNCEICKKFTALVIILLQEEKRKNIKLDIKKMVEKGIVEYMVFGDGIQFLN